MHRREMWKIIAIATIIALWRGLGAAGEAGVQPGWEAGAEMVAAKKEFGLTKEQIRNIAMDIPPNTAVGLILIEHLWAKKFKEIGLATGDPTQFGSFEQLFEAYRRQINHLIDVKMRGNNIIERLYATRMPAPFLSALVDDRRIVDLPLAGRNVISLASLLPVAVLTLVWGCNWPVLKLGVTEIAPLTFRQTYSGPSDVLAQATPT